MNIPKNFHTVNKIVDVTTLRCHLDQQKIYLQKHLFGGWRMYKFF